MGFTRTDYYEGIIQSQIRSGRASNKSEVIHQALALLDSVNPGLGPVGASFRNREELETLIQNTGEAHPMTPKRKALIYGSLKK